jgi:serine-protein kinase ATM
VLSYVIGIGDRHLSNILLNLDDSTINFVDFELIMRLGLRQPIPELVQIRMTNIMKYMHGSFGFHGVFTSWFKHSSRSLFGQFPTKSSSNKHNDEKGKLITNDEIRFF